MMFLFLLAAPLLVTAAYCDLRYMRIPNQISLLLVAAFLLAALHQPLPDLQARIAVAAAVLVLGFAAFALRLFGGGDVKLLSALMLYIPAAGLADFAYVFSAAMLTGIAAVLLARKLHVAQNSHWKSMSGTRGFPMGISIALAGLSFPLATGFVAAPRRMGGVTPVCAAPSPS